jgi:hypothetical protein
MTVSRTEDSMTIAAEGPALATDVAGFCRALGIGRSLAWYLITSGQVHSVKIGRRRVIPLSELDRLLEEGVPEKVPA